MLAARFVVDVHTSKGLDDYKLLQTMDNLDRIDFESLVLSVFQPQDIAEYGITVTVHED